MIKELSIKNLVIIDEVYLDLDKGFIVFTGETGAGKSLLVKAFKLLLGEKFSTDFLKPGTNEGEIEALILGGKDFSYKLKELGYPQSEEIHIIRTFSPKKQKIFINGELASLNDLSYLMKDVILLTSQHEFFTLLNSERQLEFLDKSLKLEDLKDRYKTLLENYKILTNKLKTLKDKIEELLQKKDFILFQIREIEELSPDPEEEEFLKKQREKLKNLNFLKTNLSVINELLSENAKNLSQVLSLFEKITKIEESFKPSEEKLLNYYYEIKEILREINSYTKDLPEDETELNRIEERLYQYEKIKKKYKKDTSELKNFVEDLKRELSFLEFGEDEYQRLEKEKEKLEKELLEAAVKLSHKRKEGAPKISFLLQEELRNLGMEKVEFLIEVFSREPKAENLTEKGLDEVKFLFSSNPGILPKPLEKIASGGELSRIFLAYQTLLQPSFSQGTIVFDEIDVGIGGITAKKVGEKLKTLSKNFQVICITHLPQIAAIADHHYLIEKTSSENETKTLIKKLEGIERLKEIARMLGYPEDIELAKKFLKGYV